MTVFFPVYFSEDENDVKLDYFKKFEIHESQNVLICCFFIENFPKNCLETISEILHFKNADYEYYLITEECNFKFKIGEFNSLFLSEKFNHNFHAIKNNIVAFLKFKKCKYKIIFAVDVSQQVKKNFDDFHICDLSKPKWWEDLSDYVTKKH